MSISLEAYRKVTPPGTVDLLYRLGEKSRGKRLLNINSTRIGGGVAEILQRMVPLMREVGVAADWEVIQGNPAFYATTKSFHNALQGQEQVIDPGMLDNYLYCNAENAKVIDLAYDFVVIHDPQPAALIDYRPSKGKWIWRCHIDVSRPQRKVWNFLRQYVAKYDAAIFSLPQFARRLPIPQYLIYPAIDPLSDKNKDLSNEEVDAILQDLDIPRDRPILLQVSRFDRFKDPIGVIDAFRLVRKRRRCILVLAGGGATDDPEGAKVLEEVQEAVGDDPDIFILVLPPTAHLEINALQRAATIILQKSLREGFGLTVSEAMWKGKPVIGGETGGITVQLVYGVTGYTVNSVEGAAFRIAYLLNNPSLIRKMGEDAREYVRHRFLITRNLRDYLSLLFVLKDAPASF